MKISDLKLKKAILAKLMNTFLSQNQLFFAAINSDFWFCNIFKKLQLLIWNCCLTFWGRHYRMSPSSFRNFKWNSIFFIIKKCGGGPHQWLHKNKKEISFPWEKRKILNFAFHSCARQIQVHTQILESWLLKAKSKKLSDMLTFLFFFIQKSNF